MVRLQYITRSCRGWRYCCDETFVSYVYVFVQALSTESGITAIWGESLWSSSTRSTTTVCALSLKVGEMCRTRQFFWVNPLYCCCVSIWADTLWCKTWKERKEQPHILQLSMNGQHTNCPSISQGHHTEGRVLNYHDPKDSTNTEVTRTPHEGTMKEKLHFQITVNVCRIGRISLV